MILWIGIQPPNDKNLWIVVAAFGLTAVVWRLYERDHFRGPPHAVLNRERLAISDPAPAET
jgi:hypothetical protein